MYFACLRIIYGYSLRRTHPQITIPPHNKFADIIIQQTFLFRHIKVSATFRIKTEDATTISRNPDITRFSTIYTGNIITRYESFTTGKSIFPIVIHYTGIHIVTIDSRRTGTD